MNNSDTTAIDPRDDGSDKASRMDQDATKPNHQALKPQSLHTPQDTPERTPDADESASRR